MVLEMAAEEKYTNNNNNNNNNDNDSPKFVKSLAYFIFVVN